MWDLILNPFITLLLLLYQLLFQNVVLAIIVFTVIVRLATYPLTQRQMRSTEGMKEVQPELKRLQEKYKGDREKLAQAQMELYRQYGINPLGGCLPLLIQLPILIGLYQAIIQSLAATPLQLMELSGRVLIPGLNAFVPMQNQFLWLNLAQPDPTLVLPILVLATTWIQQRLIMPPPQPGEEGQAAAMTRSMTTVLPIMYFFFALSFASGLSIYFVVSNVIGIVQYTMMGRADFSNLFRFGNRGQAAKPAAKPAAEPKKAAPAASRRVTAEASAGASGSGGSKSSKSKPAAKSSSKPADSGGDARRRRKPPKDGARVRSRVKSRAKNRK